MTADPLSPAPNAVVPVVTVESSGKCARTSQLRRKVGGISEKMLIQTLRRLERNGFVSRRAYPEVPPRVEYSLTALVASLSEPITTLDRWVENHLQDIAMAQREFDRHDG